MGMAIPCMMGIGRFQEMVIVGILVYGREEKMVGIGDLAIGKVDLQKMIPNNRICKYELNEKDIGFHGNHHSAYCRLQKAAK
jgi:hypothetical protein